MANLLDAKRVAQWLLVSVMVGTRLLAQKAPVTDKDILPIVQRCIQCHGGDVQMGNLDLRTRASILQGGNSGAAITPGNADDSLLIKRVTGTVKPQMPMSPVPKLNPDEIAVLKKLDRRRCPWNLGQRYHHVGGSRCERHTRGSRLPAGKFSRLQRAGDSGPRSRVVGF